MSSFVLELTEKLYKSFNSDGSWASKNDVAESPQVRFHPKVCIYFSAIVLTYTKLGPPLSIFSLQPKMFLFACMVFRRLLVSTSFNFILDIKLGHYLINCRLCVASDLNNVWKRVTSASLRLSSHKFIRRDISAMLNESSLFFYNMKNVVLRLLKRSFIIREIRITK